MNPVAKELWVNALSGKLAVRVPNVCEIVTVFEQIHGPLCGKTTRGNPGYCAIGVLVYLYCTTQGKFWEEVVDGLEVDEDVFKWADFDPWTTIITAGERTGRIFSLNDYFKIPFPVLAEAIRTQL